MTRGRAPSTGAVAGIETRRRVTPYAELHADPFQLRLRVKRGGSVALIEPDAAAVAAAVCALDGWAAAVFLPPDAGAQFPERTVHLRSVDFARVPAPAEVAQSEGERVSTRWTIFTSGTTGTPQPVSHSVRALTRTVRLGNGRRWGLLYSPSRMAGIQVVLQGLIAGETVVDAGGIASINAVLAWYAERAVDALSATPTMWRRILQSPAAARLQLRQVTLGGEIADAGILGALTRAFPQARITHVFASTETGVAFSVSDKKPGFPRRYLADPPAGVRLEIRDGVLFVEAPDVSTAGPDGFASTGDLVVEKGDRVNFLGRASGAVNIGGMKIWPEQVERVLREHPDVLDAVVIPRRNPFSGWLLTAEVVVSGEQRELQHRLRRFCAARLAGAAVPASIKTVDVLRESASGKAERH